MRLLLALIAVLAAAGEAAAASPVDRYIDRAWPERTSGTVMVARHGDVVTCRSFGMADRAARVRARCGTVYDVMSITKQFTAAAILKLETLGRLRVSDPISRWVGPVPDDKRAIAIGHLLAHTSGLVESLGDDYDPLTREQLVAGALAAPLRSPPGAEYHYSNTGYSLLAAIVEHASGMSYERFLARHLFRPAGMRQTGYVLPRWKRARVAVEYNRRGVPQGRPYDQPWAADGPYWNLRGNGGMLSTARDMLRWHRALESDTVLPARAKRELFAPRIAIPGEPDFRSAYGWGVARTAAGRVVAHTGGNGWSFGLVARFLRPGVLVFWISNDASRALERRYRSLTFGIARRVPRS